MTGRVLVVGLGPGDPRLVGPAVADAAAAVPVRFLRTQRHPSAGLVHPATSFDWVYEAAGSIEDVYAAIVEELVSAAGTHGAVLYAVPGSPFVAERTVALLRDDPRVEVEVVPAMSFLDLAWARLGVDPVGSGARVLDGQRFAEEAAGHPGPFLVAQCDTRFTLSDIKLSVERGPRVTVLQRLGLPDESVRQVAWEDLDRLVEPDHLTCVWVPTLAEPVAAELTRFAELVRTLRERCPWDSRQTHASLARHLIEETYEVLEAIDEVASGQAVEDGFDHLREELGDLLFQVAFHANLAYEQGRFGLSDVARGIHDKLVDRHPHVFGPPGSAVPDWEEMKRAEKGRSSVMEGVPGSLPALLYAHKVQSRAASVGFDWDGAAGAWPKIAEELAELGAALEGAGGPGAPADELGDVLFSVVNVARHLGLDPEASLRGSAAKFRRRFVEMESLARSRGRGLGEDLWEEVKGRQPPAPGPASPGDAKGAPPASSVSTGTTGATPAT